MTSVRLNPTVAAIVVTRDRLPLLQRCLAGLRAQTRPCDEILVVDNGSGDGTAQWLASQEGLTVLRQDNTGRIACEFRNYLVLDSVAVHDTPQNVGTVPERVTPQTLSKYCFGARNYVAMVRRADQPLPRRARRILGFFMLNVHMVLQGR